MYYDKKFLEETMMGPNVIPILEEITLNTKLSSNMKVLDLGCGKGLSSIFLADKFDVQVYAIDLWISQEENESRFKRLGLENKLTAINACASNLPFDENYFDAIISVDAYHYFGRDVHFIDKKIAPLLKKDCITLLAFPGLKKDIHDNIPKELLLSWSVEDIQCFHSCDWWSNVFIQSKNMRLESIKEMKCFDSAWNDWLESENEYAISDRLSMENGAVKYMNIISSCLYKI